MISEPPVISLRSASFGYAGRAVVSGVDLEIRRGEIVAVLGPNGSGKSTLMRGVLGLNDHIDGDLELFGTPASAFKERTRIGYVPQRHTLSASVRATVEEIVEVGRLPHRPWYRRASAADRAAVRSALHQVGLSDRAASDVSALSGGQHRRVLIARALCAEPDVLVMDEPTAGVDTASQEVLAAVLEQLAGTGVTMVIVTHEIEALAGIITRIVEVTHGHLSFDGTPAEYAARFSKSLSGQDHLHIPGSHAAHHEDEASETGPGYAQGPLDTAHLHQERRHRG